MKYRIISLLLILLVITEEVEGSQSSVTSSNQLLERPIRVGITEIPPLVLLESNGNHRGYMMDIYRLIESQFSIELDFVIYDSWGALLSAAEKRQVDVVYLAQKNESRLAYLDFSQPIVDVENYFLVHENDNRPLNNFSLKRVRLAVTKSSANHQHLSHLNYSLTVFDTAEEMLTKLSEQQVDVVLLDAGRASYYTTKLAIDNVKVAATSPFNYQLSIATRNDEPKLTLFFEQAIRSIPETKINALKLKWGLIEKQPVNWSLLYAALIAVVVLSGMIFYMMRLNRKLKKEIISRAEFEQLLAKANAEMQTQRNKAVVEARTDPLTGAHNRRRFNEYLESEIAQYYREKRVFSLIMLDIDYFKSINDDFGHDVGDAVLIAVCETLTNTFRPYDHVGRVGGEEFAIILPGIQKHDAVAVAERVRKNIKAVSLPELMDKTATKDASMLNNALKPNDSAAEKQLDSQVITISLGVTEIKEGDDRNSICKRADDALYQSKESGRDKVTLF